MKKLTILMAIIAVVSFAGMAQASTIAFSWGANFVNFTTTELGTSSGQAAGLQWYVDDFAYGVRAERNTILSVGQSDDIDVMEVTVDKWVNKFVAIGIGLGSLSNTNNDYFSSGSAITIPCVDVRGTINLLSSKGDKISTSVDFNIAARFATAPSATIKDPSNNAVTNLGGVVATLGVTLGL